MHALIIDDDIELSSALSDCLKSTAFSVDVKHTGKGGLTKATIGAYDLIVLDYHLPDTNGFDLCREVRARGKSMPILMISVNDTVNAKVDVLNAGADDYLCKPFSFQEFTARAHALTRRPMELKADIISNNEIEIDSLKGTARYRKQELSLTKKEFLLLEYFLKNQGRIISHGELIDHAWGKKHRTKSNTLETHISYLRKKIKNGQEKYIQTVSGRGYRFNNAVKPDKEV